MMEDRMELTNLEQGYLCTHRQARSPQLSPNRHFVAFLMERISPFSGEKPILVVISANEACAGACFVCQDIQCFSWLSSDSIFAVRQINSIRGKGTELLQVNIASGQITVLDMFFHNFTAVATTPDGILLYDQGGTKSQPRQTMGVSSGKQFWACAQGYSPPSIYRYQNGRLTFQASGYLKEFSRPDRQTFPVSDTISVFLQQNPMCPALPSNFLVSHGKYVFEAGSYRIQALIASPREIREKNPVLVYFPDSGESMGTCFEGLHRILCSRGFTVLYCQMSLETACSDAAAHLLDRMLKQLRTERQNVILQGTGYGGTVILRLCQTGDPFAGAIALAPVGNFITHKYLSVDYWNDPEHFSDLCDRYSAYSPLYSIASHHTPTLLLHGKKDYHVWMAESIQLFSSLKLHQIPARLCLFPEGEHNLLLADHLSTYSSCISESLVWIERCMIGGVDIAGDPTA